VDIDGDDLTGGRAQQHRGRQVATRLDGRQERDGVVGRPRRDEVGEMDRADLGGIDTEAGCRR